jgi:hypothetical protein
MLMIGLTIESMGVLIMNDFTVSDVMIVCGLSLLLVCVVTGWHSAGIAFLCAVVGVFIKLFERLHCDGIL